VGIVLGARAPAAAQPAVLSWQAPSSCASKAAIELKIRQLLGAQPAAPAELVRAQVRIERARGRYQLRLLLEIGSHRAERRLHAASCEELGETVAWMIALAVNPELSAPHDEGEARAGTGQGARDEADAVSRQTAGSQSSDTSSSQTAQTAGREDDKAQAAHGDKAAKPDPKELDAARANADERETAENDRERLTIVNKDSAGDYERVLRAGANAGVFSGGPSGVQATLGAFVGVSLGWSHTQARFSGLLPRQIDIAPGASANIWSLMLDVTQCALWGQTIRVGPCLTLAGLRTAAQVRGLTQPTHQAALWANTGAGLQLFWRLAHHLELSLSVSAGVPISPRPRFTVQGVMGTIGAAKGWSSDARLGLSFASN
jgi:hypothetical protein